MNKMLATAFAVLGVSFCFAAEEAVLEDVNPEMGRISVRLGYFEPLGGSEDFDLEGVAVEAELIVRPMNNLAFGFRGTVGGADEEYDFFAAGDRYHWPVGAGELTYSDYNLAAQVYFSLFRNENFDIYLTGGLYYDSAEYEYEYYGTYHHHGYTISDDCSTIGFLGGIGLELKNDFVGVKLEADYLSKPDYDEVSKLEDEKAQIQAFGSLMFFVGDQVAFDFSGRYFTEWEDLYAMFGLTVIF